MQVAFITGRTEDGREITERNLKSEGFGEKCPTDDSGKVERTKDEPCYVALHLRNLKGALLKPLRASLCNARLLAGGTCWLVFHVPLLSMVDQCTSS